MLVFDIEQQFERLNEKGFEKFPNKRDLTILCNVWLSRGKKKEELKPMMVDFCRQWNPRFNYALSENLILDVLKSVENEEKNDKNFQFCQEISVFKEEIGQIKAIKDKNLQKIAFIIICLAKWRNANYIYLNSGSSIKLRDIFTFAGIKKTGRQMEEDLYALNNIGFIDVQLKPLLKYFVPSIKDSGELAFKFRINDDMIQEWINIVGIKCSICGKSFEKHCNSQKYCKECAKKIKAEQIKAIKKRKNEKNKKNA